MNNIKNILNDHRLWLDTKGIQGQRASFHRADLSGMDLSGEILEDIDFYYANLTKTNFFGANLKKSCFYGANLQKANFEKSILSFSELTYSNLLFANLTNAKINDTNLSFSSLESCVAHNTDFSYSNFDGASLLEADLQGSNLKYTYMVDAVIRNANLLKTNLTGINLYQTNFVEAVFPPKKITIGCLYKIKNIMFSKQEENENVYCLLDIDSDGCLKLVELPSGTVHEKVPCWIKYSMRKIKQ